jgi:hypothetical protein
MWLSLKINKKTKYLIILFIYLTNINLAKSLLQTTTKSLINNEDSSEINLNQRKDIISRDLQNDLEMRKFSILKTKKKIESEESNIYQMIELFLKYNELIDLNVHLNPNQKKILNKNYSIIKNKLHNYVNEGQLNAKKFQQIVAKLNKTKDIGLTVHNSDISQKLNQPFKWG